MIENRKGKGKNEESIIYPTKQPIIQNKTGGISKNRKTTKYGGYKQKTRLAAGKFQNGRFYGYVFGKGSKIDGEFIQIRINSPKCKDR